jgi:hypothetical protein
MTPFPLSFCLNACDASTWKAAQKSLDAVVPAVKALVAPRRPFPVSRHLGTRARREALSRQTTCTHAEPTAVFCPGSKAPSPTDGFKTPSQNQRVPPETGPIRTAWPIPAGRRVPDGFSGRRTGTGNTTVPGDGAYWTRPTTTARR